MELHRPLQSVADDALLRRLAELTRQSRCVDRSKREIEELLAELSPRPDAATWIRKMPEPQASRATAKLRPPASSPAPAPAPAHTLVPAALSTVASPPFSRGCVPETQLVLDRVARPVELHADGVAAVAPDVRRHRPGAIEPLSPARYKVQFTASATLRGKLERLQSLMRSSVPDGDLAAIVEAAVTEKLQRLEARRFASTPKPRKTLAESDTTASSSRQIPAAVKRVVRERDGNQCRFVDAQGRRCTQRDRLEFHHRHPHGLGGDRSPENLSLLCRAHNAYLAEIDYGSRVRARDSALVALEGRQVDQVLWSAGRALVPGEVCATQKREAVILDHERRPT